MAQSKNVNQLLAMAQQAMHAGQYAAAESLFKQVLAARPRTPEALVGLGLIRNLTGRPAEAVEPLKQAIAIQPYLLAAHATLGGVYHSLGRFEEAEAAFRQFLTLQPENALMHYNLAMALKGLRRREEAVASYRRALELKPDYADAWFNLGNVQRDLAKFEDALQSYQQALRIKPDFAEACNNLGHTLVNLGRMDEAIETFRRAMSLRPSFLDPMPALANALSAVGRPEEALDVFRKYVQLRPEDERAHAGMMMAMHYQPAPDPQQIFEEHVRWGERFAPLDKMPREPFTNERSPDRRLRVGYVSCDFRQHSVAFFIEGLLRRHDPSQVEIFGYNTNSYVDQVTERLRHHAHAWRDAARMDPAELAAAIRSDRVDVLVDLTGHTAGSRVLAMARRPAPVQVSYLGYIDTTGMRQVDYRMADTYTDPPGMTERFYTEELVRLPRTFAVYTPPTDAPDVSETPAATNGYVTFGAFTIGAKISAPLIGSWGDVLARTPNARLIVAGNGVTTPTVRARIAQGLTSRGIDASRFEVLGSQPLAQYLASHSRVDILLDPFPVNGHTITCHALWMGVPAISLAGGMYWSRLGASVLSNLGLTELIATSAEQYAETAARLAQDVGTISEIRKTMRDRMRGSPLMDHASFAREVETAYRTMWRRWLAMPR